MGYIKSGNSGGSGPHIEIAVYLSYDCWLYQGSDVRNTVVDFLDMVFSNQFSNPYAIHSVSDDYPFLDAESMENGAYEDFRHYINNENPPIKADDSNLVITNASSNGPTTGTAAQGGIVAAAEGGPEINQDVVGGPVTRYGYDAGHFVMNIAIQEIGHNLGMDHLDGHAENNSYTNEYEVSPMITSYQDMYDHQNNSCSDYIEEKWSGYTTVYDHYYHYCALENDNV